MSTCAWDRLANVRAGDVLRLNAHYNTAAPAVGRDGDHGDPRARDGGPRLRRAVAVPGRAATRRRSADRRPPALTAAPDEARPLPHPSLLRQPGYLRRIFKDPQPVLDQLCDEHGPIVGLGGGPVRMAIVGDPTALRELYGMPTDTFRWGHKFNVLGFVVGPSSMIVSDGADHKRRRSSVQAAFSRRRLNGWIPMIVDRTDAVARPRRGRGRRGPTRRSTSTPSAGSWSSTSWCGRCSVSGWPPRLTRSARCSPARRPTSRHRRSSSCPTPSPSPPGRGCGPTAKHSTRSSTARSRASEQNRRTTRSMSSPPSSPRARSPTPRSATRSSRSSAPASTPPRRRWPGWCGARRCAPGCGTSCATRPTRCSAP